MSSASLTPDQIAFLTSNGWTDAGGFLVASATILGTVPTTDFIVLETGDPVSFDTAIPAIPGDPATAGTPNQGGVTIALGADITASRVAVDGNSTAGSVIGNNAANGLMISATTIADGSLLATSTALDAGIDGATADHSLSNFQRAGGPSLESTVFGSFGIDGADGALVTDATLSVSDNSQSATSIASTADNSVSLTGNTITAGSALASVQEGYSAGLWRIRMPTCSFRLAYRARRWSFRATPNGALAVIITM